MSYKCYLFGQLMPETPSKLTVKIKGKNKTLELLNEGEINFLRTPGLTEITLPLTFPMLTGSRRPEYYLNLLEKTKTGRSTTQFIMTRTTPNGRLLFDTNIKVSVEDYTITESATNGLDVSVEVNLKQYRDYGTKTIKVETEAKKTTAAVTQQTQTQKQTTTTKTATVTKERATTTAPKATTYTVKKGDTLWGVAKKFLGNGAKYNLIFNANKDKIKNPNLIYVGQTFTIPQVK
ncbi:MAG: LysM peptidoglycan-binding domain-containing protein [Ruminococcus sp.]|nr:LysM peptidoglycan-binding domain-containing protein [Ruminococcus sp.]